MNVRKPDFFLQAGNFISFVEDGNLQVVEISDNPDEDKMESMQEKILPSQPFS